MKASGKQGIVCVVVVRILFVMRRAPPCSFSHTMTTGHRGQSELAHTIHSTSHILYGCIDINLKSGRSVRALALLDTMQKQGLGWEKSKLRSVFDLLYFRNHFNAIETLLKLVKALLSTLATLSLVIRYIVYAQKTPFHPTSSLCCLIKLGYLQISIEKYVLQVKKHDYRPLDEIFTPEQLQRYQNEGVTRKSVRSS